MLKVASQAWQEWGTRGRRTDRAAWVASRINKVFGKTRFIRPKWVNQNREAVETFLRAGTYNIPGPAAIAMNKQPLLNRGQDERQLNQ
jgi:hypothetical protein